MRATAPGSSGSSSTSASDERATVGQPVPDISGTTLDGATFDLASLRGRPVIVNFWASWCGPCVQEFPLLRSTLQAHQSDGLAIVGVLFKDDAGPATAFVHKFGAGWPTILDPGGVRAAAYTVVAPPQSYFVDRQGVLRYRQIGELLQQDLDAHLGSILG